MSLYFANVVEYFSSTVFANSPKYAFTSSVEAVLLPSKSNFVLMLDNNLSKLSVLLLLARLISFNKSTIRSSIPSIIFWGPPGVGKTTLAEIIAHKTKSVFITFSAVTSGIKEIKDVMEEAEHNRSLGVNTILFIDEIHRFNKAQQDAFLPYVEKGSIILIGATTENPAFTINNALLSRCKVFVLEPLESEDIVKLLKRA